MSTKGTRRGFSSSKITFAQDKKRQREAGTEESSGQSAQLAGQLPVPQLPALQASTDNSTITLCYVILIAFICDNTMCCDHFQDHRCIAPIHLYIAHLVLSRCQHLTISCLQHYELLCQVMTAQPKAQFEELALAFNNASSPHRTPGALRVHYWLGTAGKHARADLLQLQIARLFGMYTKECTADIGSLAKALGPEKSADVEGLQELAGHAQQLADAACHTAQEPFSLLQQLPSQVGSAAWLAALQDINE